MSLATLDIGVDENGAQALLDDLNTNIVNALQQKLRDLDGIFAILDRAWEGEDRDIYKANVKKTIENCCTALDSAKTEFAREIEEINSRMSEFRRSHVSDESY